MRALSPEELAQRVREMEQIVLSAQQNMNRLIVQRDELAASVAVQAEQSVRAVAWFDDKVSLDRPYAELIIEARTALRSILDIATLPASAKALIAELARMREALGFYAFTGPAWKSQVYAHKPGITYWPSDELLGDQGRRASQALKGTTNV